MLLGRVTDTLDTSGTVREEREVNVSADEVRACLQSFAGKQKQIPPMYSALKKDGKRLYELARAGMTIEREARDIIIYDLKILSAELPRVSFEVTCSRGTYIRSLCDDAGRKLGCGACMEHLERTQVGAFTAEKAVRLPELEILSENGRLKEAVLEMTAAFPELNIVRAAEQADKPAHNGNAIPLEYLPGLSASAQRFWLEDSAGKLIGIYGVKRGMAHPVKMVYED